MLQVATPWARSGSGFTLLFEGVILSMAKSMPIANIAAIVGEHDTRIWRVVHHDVGEAVEAQDLSQVRRIAVDETSAKRGHDYITLFADIARRLVVYVADGKSGAAVDEFGAWLEARGGDRADISDVSMDMSAAFSPASKPISPMRS